MCQEKYQNVLFFYNKKEMDCNNVFDRIGKFLIESMGNL